MEKQIIIQKSRIKIFFILQCASLLFTLGFVMELKSFSEREPLSILNISVIITSFAFAFTVYLMIRQLFSNKVALVINDEGFLFNVTNPDGSFLKWDEIRNISTTNVFITKFIYIQVKDPDTIIAKQENKREKKLMRTRQDRYGAPILISTSLMKISQDKLLKILIDKLHKYTIA